MKNVYLICVSIEVTNDIERQMSFFLWEIRGFWEYEIEKKIWCMIREIDAKLHVPMRRLTRNTRILIDCVYNNIHKLSFKCLHWKSRQQQINLKEKRSSHLWRLVNGYGLIWRILDEKIGVWDVIHYLIWNYSLFNS